MLILCCFVALAVLNISNNEVLANEEEMVTNRAPYTSLENSENATPNQYIAGNIAKTNTEEYKYLSDLDYITTNNWSYVGWGSIRKDMPPEGSTITLKVDGKNKLFLKGMGIHANAQLTYDISSLSGKYTRFVTKAGIDTSRGTKGNVWFQILVSNDGTNWTQLYKSGSVTGGSEALDINVSIAGYRYLRIYVNTNGSADSDHAVLGGAKLITEDYVQAEENYDKIHTLEYYDEILGSKDAKYNYENNYRLILEREFVNKIGYDSIIALANYTSSSRATLDWLLSSNYNLEQVIEVGELSSGVRFIKVLSDLYSEYEDVLTRRKWKIIYQNDDCLISCLYNRSNNFPNVIWLSSAIL